MNVDQFEPRYFGGVAFDYMATENVGLHWSVGFGKDYFHMPAGPIGGLFGGFWVGSKVANGDSAESGDGIVIGLIAFVVGAVVPEGVSYNVKVSDQFYVAPYVNPLQIDFMRADQGQDTFFGGSVGVRTNLLVGKSRAKLSPFVEYKMLYSRPGSPGFSAGLSWSLLLKNDGVRQ